MRTLAVAAMALSLTVAAGCSDGGGPDDGRPTELDSGTSTAGPSGPTESGSASPTGAPPTAPEPGAGLATAFDASAQTTFDETGVVDVGASDDVVLTLTGERLLSRTLPDLEAGWSLDSEAAAFVDLWVRPGERWGYLLEVSTTPGVGTRVGSDRLTVRRFALATGEVDATADATIAQDPRGSAQAAGGRIVGVAGDRVVVDSAAPDEDAIHAAAVLDLGTGKAAWRDRGAEALLLAPGLVVTSTGRPDTAGRLEGRAVGSGKVRWRGADDTLGAAGVGSTDDGVLVLREEAVFGSTAVLSLSARSGRLRSARTVTEPGWACAPGTARVAVCGLTEPGRVIGWDLARNRPAWSLPSAARFAPRVTLVQDGLVYGVLDSGTGVVLEAGTGRDVAGAGGAAPSAVSAWGGVVLFGDRAIFVPAGRIVDPGGSA